MIHLSLENNFLDGSDFWTNYRMLKQTIVIIGEKNKNKIGHQVLTEISHSTESNGKKTNVKQQQRSAIFRLGERGYVVNMSHLTVQRVKTHLTGQ